MDSRDPGSRTGWLTAVFWTVTAAFAYVLLGLLFPWAWLPYLGSGLALTYLWWKRRHRGRYSVLFGATCAFFALMAVGVSGAALLVPVSLPVDSVGPRRVDCGSVVDRVPADELTVTTGDSNEPAVQSRSIPQGSLERKCSDWLDGRGGRAAGLALIGLFVGARATGHFVRSDGVRSVGVPASSV
ncbi:hypothetical protein [Rhodococcus kronopolitis]|uniref:Uncharacterized protein n=1 Tax=Rhodococcus kronopolitis TaxID=1460226 RepID=A0ABV9FQW6_9NOCA